MEVLRRVLTQIRAQLGQMNPATAWLIVFGAVILVMVGGLLLLYVAQPETESIGSFPADRQAQVLAKLQNDGVRATITNGQIMVSVGDRDRAWAVLAQGDLLGSDTTTAFEDMLKRQSPWLSNAQSAQLMHEAKRRALESMVMKMTGVRASSVIISIPQEQGFGRSAIRPSASVTVVMQPGVEVRKPLVQAIAGLVSGAVAGMRREDVTIVDANVGKAHTAKTEEGFMASDELEMTHQVEEYHRNKVAELLSYIPGVIVAVNVRTDPVRARSVEETTFEPSEPLREETSKETERNQISEGGEAAVRPNTGLDISQGSRGSGTLERTSETTSKFGDKNIVKRSQHTEVGGMAKQINVTINIPRAYFVSVWAQGKKAEEVEKGPDDASLKTIVDAQISLITQQVQPMISAEAEGVVRAAMIPDSGGLFVQGGRSGGGLGGTILASGGSSASVMGIQFDWIKTGGLALLACASLALMLGMVRKATQQPPIPSIEELAGVPPPLPVDDDLVGEAQEGDASMTGLELDEGELRTRKVAEQIAEMVKANPTEAASLLRRWIQKET